MIGSLGVYFGAMEEILPGVDIVSDFPLLLDLWTFPQRSDASIYFSVATKKRADHRESRRGKFVLAWNQRMRWVKNTWPTTWLNSVAWMKRTGKESDRILLGASSWAALLIRNHVVATETVAGRSEFCCPLSWSVQFAFPPEDISCIFATENAKISILN